jgi:cytochrome c peroxidase
MNMQQACLSWGMRKSYVGLVLAMIAGTLAGCSGAGPVGPQTKQYLLPIPSADEMARPRSAAQTGLPVETTRLAIPPDNPQTSDKIALGQRLFFDGRLSVDGTVACSSCHDPARAFTDGRPVSIGIKGRVGQRNAPTILNALYNTTQFWDGRARTLEEQAAFPIVNPSEMGQPSVDAVVTRLAKLREYNKAFGKVFGGPPSAVNLLLAIASYERSEVSFDSPFDHFVAGDKKAINDSAKRGWALFNGRGRCIRCHSVSAGQADLTFFTDHRFHNIGVVTVRAATVAMAHQADQAVRPGDMGAVDRTAIQSDFSVLGRFLVTRQDADIGAFKTPGLRNLLMTEPFFHNGSHATLWDVVDHYNKGGDVNDPFLDTQMQPLGLKEAEIDDLVAFLASLTSPEYRKPADQELARERRLSRTTRPFRDTSRALGRAPK